MTGVRFPVSELFFFVTENRGSIRLSLRAYGLLVNFSPENSSLKLIMPRISLVMEILILFVIRTGKKFLR